jgi:hypothetical protein
MIRSAVIAVPGFKVVVGSLGNAVSAVKEYVRRWIRLLSPECEGCGNDLNVNTVDRPHIDWVKVVCSECGHITEVSMIRLSKETAEGGA